MISLIDRLLTTESARPSTALVRKATSGLLASSGITLRYPYVADRSKQNQRAPDRFGTNDFNSRCGLDPDSNPLPHIGAHNSEIL